MAFQRRPPSTPSQDGPGSARPRALSDPRAAISAQDLIYAATALRAEARRAEQRAAEPQFLSSRQIFDAAAKANDDLAEKLTRIAKALGG